MLKITFIAKTTREKAGLLPVRFRLCDGRKADISHKSTIRGSAADLAKFTPEGQLRPHVSVYNRTLFDAISREIDYMKRAYDIMRQRGMDMNSKVLDTLILDMQNPVEAIRHETKTLVTQFDEYIKDAVRDNVMGERRAALVNVVRGKLDRFLHIRGLSYLSAGEFDDKMLMEFRQFLYDEYKYVPEYRSLYQDMRQQNIPEKRLSSNTVVSQLKMLQTFFSELEFARDIERSPFHQLSKERKRAVMKTKYDEPICLTGEEFNRILNAKVSKCYSDVRDAFVVNCAIGCRISDFITLTMDNVSVSPEGIPYVHYLPQKTAGESHTNAEIQTPLVRFAFEIIKRTGFAFKTARNIYGNMGYNAQLKGLLQECGIDRKVPVYNDQAKRNEYKPVCELASTKLARKTHIDMLTKIQIDEYAAGLHKEGSGVVHRYMAYGLKDRFALYNLAFKQKGYRVGEDLEIK